MTFWPSSRAKSESHQRLQVPVALQGRINSKHSHLDNWSSPKTYSCPQKWTSFETSLHITSKCRTQGHRVMVTKKDPTQVGVEHNTETAGHATHVCVCVCCVQAWVWSS